MKNISRLFLADFSGYFTDISREKWAARGNFVHQNAAHAFGFGSGVRTFCYVLSYDLCVDGNFMGIILTPIMSLVIRYQIQVF